MGNLKIFINRIWKNYFPLLQDGDITQENKQTIMRSDYNLGSEYTIKKGRQNNCQSLDDIFYYLLTPYTL